MSAITKVLCASVALLAAASVVPTASAQTAPPGYILDVGALNAYGLAPYAYTYYSTTFVATLASTTVSFAFRDDPAYFSFDDVSVALTGGGPNLLADPGFESATVGSSHPAGWGYYFYQPSILDAAGIVETGAPTGYADNPNSGSNYWFDGSVLGYDGIGQTVATTIGDSYTIGFYLAEDETYQNVASGLPPAEGDFNPVYRDVYVYAQSGVPPLPEPATWSMLLIGVAGIGAAIRHRRQGSLGFPA